MSIASTYTVVDLGEGVSTVTLPIYTNNAILKLKTKPDWLYVSGLSEGGGIHVVSNKAELTLKNAQGYFAQQLDDYITISDIGETEELVVSVIWSFKSDSISLDDVADQFELMSESTPIETINRKKILIALKNNLQKLSFNGFGQLKRFDCERDSTSRVFCPIDMVEPVRLFAVDTYGNKQIMYRDDNLNVGSYSPLKDENGSVILDSNEYWLEGSGLAPTPSSTSVGYYGFINPLSLDHTTDLGGLNHLTNLAGLKGGVKSFFGQYGYVKEGGYFFIQDCPYDYFTLEYVSDPILSDQMKKGLGEMFIPKYWSEALKAHTFHELIKWRSDVPMGEKELARVEANRQTQLAKRMQVDYAAIVQANKTRRDINKR